MLTKNLIGLIADATGMSKKKTEELLSASNAIIRESLMSGKAVQLQGLGTLEIKEKKERVIVMPNSGERITVPTKNQLVFRPVVNIKDELKNI